jgi:hypothetical protein
MNAYSSFIEISEKSTRHHFYRYLLLNRKNMLECTPWRTLINYINQPLIIYLSEVFCLLTIAISYISRLLQLKLDSSWPSQIRKQNKEKLSFTMDLGSSKEIRFHKATSFLCNALVCTDIILHAFPPMTKPTLYDLFDKPHIYSMGDSKKMLPQECFLTYSTKSLHKTHSSYS